MAHAPDPVGRWDASQQLFASLIHRAIAAQTTVKLDEDTVAACRALLQSDSDPALIALALTLLMQRHLPTVMTKFRLSNCGITCNN